MDLMFRGLNVLLISQKVKQSVKWILHICLTVCWINTESKNLTSDPDDCSEKLELNLQT